SVPVPALRQISRARRGPALGGPLRVRRAGGARARAALREVALAGGRAALGARRLQCVAWARGARPGTDLRHVAVSRRRTALGAGRLEHVRGAVVGDAVAALGDVAVARGRTADCRALLVRRARGVRAGAELGHV